MATEIKNILLTTDLSEASWSAFSMAKTLARSNDATLHVAHVVEEPFALFEAREAVKKIVQDAEQHARSQITEVLEKHDVEAATHVFSDSRPAEELINRAKEFDIDLIVIASHGRTGLVGWVLGSTVERILRKSEIPVLVVRASDESTR